MSVESFYRYVIQAHNPYTKSFQYWHSVFERKLLSLRGLVSINNRRHSVSILIDQCMTIRPRIFTYISIQHFIIIIENGLHPLQCCHFRFVLFYVSNEVIKKIYLQIFSLSLFLNLPSYLLKWMAQCHKAVCKILRTSLEYAYLLSNKLILNMINSDMIKKGQNLMLFLVTESSLFFMPTAFLADGHIVLPGILNFLFISFSLSIYI